MKYSHLSLSLLMGLSLAWASGCATTKSKSASSQKSGQKTVVSAKSTPAKSKAALKAEPKDEADFEEYMDEDNDFAIGSEDDYKSDLYILGTSAHYSQGEGDHY